MSKLKCIHRRPEATWLLYLATGLLATLFATAARAADFGTATAISTATSLTSGTLTELRLYKITGAAGSLDFTTCGSPNNTVGTTFVTNSTPCTLTAGDSVDLVAEPNQVVSSDIDGDGKLDLAFADVEHNRIILRKGAGDGTFTSPWASLNVDTAGGDGPFALAVGHFNDDATVAHPENDFLDIAVANVYSDNVSVFLGNGDGTFDPATVYDVGVNPTSIVAADFDGAHFTDLAVTNYGDDTVSILLSNADGTFTKNVTDPATAAGPWAITSAALINAGAQDLIVADYAANKISVLMGNGDGTFDDKVDTVVGTGPTSITTGYFNAGTGLDVAVTNFGDDTVSVLLGNNDGTFAAEAHYDVGLEPMSVAAGDFNGTLNGTMTAGDSLVTGNTYTVLTQGALDFTDFGAANNTAGTTFVATSDTLVATDALVIGVTYTIVTRTTTNFTANSCGAANNNVGTTFTSGCTSTLGTGDSVVTVGKLGTGDSVTDFKGGDADGKLDLAVANRGDDNISILRGDGQGVFTFAENYAVGVGPSSLITADLNADTILDLVTANRFDDSASILLALQEDTPPTGSISIAAGAVWVDTVHVPLTLSATEESGGAISMCISNTTTCSNGTGWIDYATSYSGELFTMGATKKLANGAVYKITGRSTLDFTANSCGAASNAVGTVFTSGCTQTLGTGDSVISLTKSEGSLTVGNQYTITANAGSLDFTTCGATNSNVNTVFVATSTCTLTDGDTVIHDVWEMTANDGLKTVYAWFKDARGNTSDYYFDTIIVDSTAPGKPIVINNNDDYTNDHDVVLSLGGAGSTQMCISDTTTCDATHGTDWTTYAATFAWTLPAGDGTKTVYAKFKNDRATSAQFFDSIILDSTAPTNVSVVIDSGKSTVFGTSVTLTLAATEESGGAISMCINNTGVNSAEVPCAPWEAFATSKAWTLANADPGTKTVYAWFKDARANVSVQQSDTIVLKSAQPTGSVLVNNGDLASIELPATLTLTKSSDVVDMCISNVQGSCATWIPFKPSVDWILAAPPEDEELTTVYAWFRTEDGIVSDEYSDGIKIDTTAPTNGAVLINAGAVATGNALVHLTIQANDSATAVASMCISNTASCSDWVLYATTYDWTLDDSSDGVKTVSVWFKDAENNATLVAATDTITLDGTAPTGTVSINAGDTNTASDEVSLALSATDASGSVVTQMCISNSTNCDQGTGWIDYATSYSNAVTLAEGELLVIATPYIITGQSTLNFTTCGSGSNTVGTPFVATVACVLGSGDTVERTATLTTGASLAEGTRYTITARATLDFRTFGAANNTANTTFVATFPTLATGAPLVAGKTYKITASGGPLDFTTFGAANSNVNTTFLAAPVTLTNGAALVVGNTYKIISRAILDFTTCGAANNTADTTFVANSAATLGAGDSVSTVTVLLGAGDTVKTVGVLGTGDSVIGGDYNKNTWTLASVNGSTTLSAGEKLAVGSMYIITGRSTLDFTAAGAANNTVGTMFIATDALVLGTGDSVSRTAILSAGDSMVKGTTYKIAAHTTIDFTTFGSANNTVGTTFVAAPVSLTAGAVLVVGNTYKITARTTLDFTTCGAANNTVNTEFVANHAYTLGVGDTVSTVNVVLGTGDSVRSTGTLVAGASLVSGTTYKITGHSTLDFTTFGAANSNVNTTFVAAPASLPAGTVLVVGNTYKITAHTTLDFTTCGAANNNVDTTFIATHVGTLGTGDTVSTVNVVLGTDDTVVGWVTASGDGTKTVNVWFKDEWGNATVAGSPNTDSIILDTTAPTAGSVSINAGAAGTSSTTVSLAISATDATVAGKEMCVSNTTTCAEEDWEALATPKSWTLTSGDGVKTVRVWFKDALGNTTETAASDTITLDTTAPTGSIVIAGAAASTTTSSVTLTLAAAGASQMCISNSNDTVDFDTCTGTGGWQAFATTKAWTLSAGDGTKTVYVWYQDALHNTDTTAYSDTIVLDTTPPTSTVSINAGATYTKVTAVTLTLTPGDATQMCVSNTAAACTAFVAVPSPATKAWTLTALNGAKTVYVTYRDPNGNTTVANDGITLDGTLPTNGTATATNGVTQVVLNWSGFSDVDSSIASYKVVTAAAGATVAPATCNTGTVIYSGGLLTTTNTGLTNGTTHYYRVCAIDQAGNMSAGVAVTGKAIAEIDPPEGTLAIGAGEFTKTAAVTLAISATDVTGPITMCVSNTETCTSYVAYATSKAWTLPTGNGLKTVRIWFKDSLGNVSTPVSDTITLDSVLPVNGTLTATGGDTKVDLSWAGFTDPGSAVSSYKLVFGATAPASCATGTVLYTGSNTTYSHTGRINGTTYYYRVCATDGAGNISSGAAANAKAKPESLAPTDTSISIAGGATYTKTASVTLTLAATDDSTKQMCVSNTTTCTAFVAFAATKTWSLLASGTALKTVYVTYRDQWGNTAARISDTITLDAVAPTNGTMAITPIEAQNDLTWSGFADAGSGLSSYKLVYSTTAMPTSCATGTTIYSGSDLSYSHINLTNGTTYYYRVCAIDAAGNTSTGATVTGRHIPETDPPAEGSISINSGNAYTNSLSATLSLSATDASTVSQMCVTNSATATAATCTPWVAYAPTKTWTLLTGATTPKTVKVWFKDQWGNTTSAAVTDSIGYDAVKPVDGTATATAGDAQVVLNWSGFGDALSGIASYKVVSSNTAAPTTCAGTAIYEGADSVTTFTHLGLTNGTKYYYRVCAIDNAGNMSLGKTLASPYYVTPAP